MSEKRNGVLIGLKIAVSATCLFFVWRSVGHADWSRLLSDIDTPLALLALAVLTVGQVASGYRHWAVLRALGRVIEPGKVVALSFAGTFFNQILPSGLGGDVVRALYLRRRCGLMRATASTVLDRVVGIIVKLGSIVLMTPFYLSLPIPDWIKFAVIGFAASVLAGLFLAAKLSASARLRRYVPQPLRIAPLFLLYLRRLGRPAALARLVLPMLGGFFPYVLCFALLGESVGGHIAPFDYLLLVPLLFVAMQFPLSFGGWGVREGAAVYLLPMVGFEPDAAFVASALFGIALLVTSLPGLAIWLNDFRRSQVPALV